jgi:hypothetical protein
LHRVEIYGILKISLIITPPYYPSHIEREMNACVH